MGSTRKSLHQSLGKNHMFGLGGSLDPPIPLLILRGHHKYCVWRCPKDGAHGAVAPRGEPKLSYSKVRKLAAIGMAYGPRA